MKFTRGLEVMNDNIANDVAYELACMLARSFPDLEWDDYEVTPVDDEGYIVSATITLNVAVADQMDTLERLRGWKG